MHVGCINTSTLVSFVAHSFVGVRSLPHEGGSRVVCLSTLDYNERGVALYALSPRNTCARAWTWRFVPFYFSGRRCEQIKTKQKKKSNSFATVAFLFTVDTSQSSNMPLVHRQMPPVP